MKKLLLAHLLMIEPVYAHTGHGYEYSIAYLAFFLAIFLLLTKLYKKDY